MINLLRDVREFHANFGVPIEKMPTMGTKERRDLRRALILEEALEAAEALEMGDLVGTADGLADLIYVAVGTALELGIPLDRVWDEVHRSNMRKVGGATREDGKILKPEGWQPPDIAGVLSMAAAETLIAELGE